MTRILLLTFAAALLTACATVPTYGPAAGDGFGYSEQIIETGRYRVNFRAPRRAEADDGALRRAAELTLQDGFTHFTVVSRSLDTVRDRSRSSIGIGGSTGGRRSGVGVGVSVPLGGTSAEAEVSLQIVMTNDPATGDPRTYDAQSTLTNLRGSFASGV